MTKRGKYCAHCGRSIDWRAMSQHDWEAMKYCSGACRRQAGARVHARLEEAIIKLLRERDGSASICPSEAAQVVFGDKFRSHMEDARRAARRLAHQSRVIITQQARQVDAASFRGPVRIARDRRFSDD